MSPAASTIFELFTVGIVLIVGFIFAAMPRLTRPSLYFAVTVHPSFRDSAEGRRALTRYRTTVIAGTVVCTLLAFLLRPAVHPFDGAVLLLTLVGISLIAFLAARRMVLPSAQEPTPQRDAELAGRRTRLPGGVPLQSLPFALLAAVAGLLLLRWGSIPARFPVHWGVNGQPNGWADRTVAGVFGPVLTGVVICSLLLVVAWGITRWSRRPAATGPLAERGARFQRLMRWVLLAAELFFAAVIGWVALLPCLPSHDPEMTAAVILVLTLVGVAVLVVVLVRAGQGGSRLAISRLADGAAEESLGDRSADHFWKAGLFYVNPDDPALFVEKRFGIGYTLNFGNLWAWVILSLVIVVPVAMAVLL
jgi:uncharacterized membrane protein